MLYFLFLKLYLSSGIKVDVLALHYSIDATSNSRMGRYVNDSPRKAANCIAKAMIFSGKPRVLLFALRDITSGSELRYDYGGGFHPWRKVSDLTFSVRFFLFSIHIEKQISYHGYCDHETN
jgi:SET domain-containing protein